MRGARGGLKLNRTLDESPHHRLASLGNPKKKKCSLHFGFARDQFFLKKEGFFLFGVLPSKYSGSVVGRNADEAKQNYFCGRKGICFASALFCAGIWYPPRRRVREECAAD